MACVKSVRVAYPPRSVVRTYRTQQRDVKNNHTSNLLQSINQLLKKLSLKQHINKNAPLCHRIGTRPCKCLKLTVTILRQWRYLKTTPFL